MKTRCFKSDSATTWTPLPSKNTMTIHSVTVINRTGGDLEVAYGGDTGETDAGVTIADGESIAMRVNSSTAEVSTKAASAVSDGVEFVFDEA